MAAPSLFEDGAVRVAVEGCGHGTLHAIYASVEKSCELKGWDGVDVLIIGGDFQAVRNALDLKAVAMPEKYREMADFHEYYAGTRTAPYLTIFIGGNHEASNYLWELFYGGWVAPNIYYMGAANVIRLGPLRIAGQSGIWKGYNFKKPHYERLPYNGSDERSIYHVREWDTRKLLQIRSQVDIGISHDWPRGMEWKGNHQQLFRFKPHFEQEAKDGTLGNVAATMVLERLRPAYWFSAHMHAKYAAVWEHTDEVKPPIAGSETEAISVVDKSKEEIALDQVHDVAPPPIPKNSDEIDLEMDDDEQSQPNGHLPKVTATGLDQTGPTENETTSVPQDIRALLPESFAQPTIIKPQVLPFPPEITNKTTHFLALDKCLPNRHFLQLLEVVPHEKSQLQRPLQLEYDREWLAITRAFADELQIGDPDARVPPNTGDAVYRPRIDKELEWVEENIVKRGRMIIPQNFAQTAPVYDAIAGIHVSGEPQEYTNPHTRAFCELLQIPNPFHASEEERSAMMQAGPRPDASGPNRGGGRGGFRGGNRGRGRGRGGGNASRRGGRGHGRW